MADLITPFIKAIETMLQSIKEHEVSAIREAANCLADTIARGGIVHVFGSGHSSAIAREIVGRAGGLVPINDIIDPTAGRAERVEGYAAELLAAYDLQYQLKQGEVLIVISNSGINPLPIEVALYGKNRGLHTIAITNLQQSQTSISRHSSGHKLFEVVDIVIDNHGFPGDAIAPLPGGDARVAAGSTIAGAMIVNLLILVSAEALLEQGLYPPVLRSQNLPGSDHHNQALFAKYRGRLRQLGA